MDLVLPLLIVVVMIAAATWVIRLLTRAYGWKGLLIIIIPAIYVAILSQLIDNPLQSTFLTFSTAVVIMSVFGYLRRTQPDRRNSSSRSSEQP
jgi:hypothetical protein